MTGEPAAAPGPLLVAAWLAAAMCVLTAVAVWSAVTASPRAVRRTVAGRRARTRGLHARGRAA